MPSMSTATSGFAEFPGDILKTVAMEPMLGVKTTIIAGTSA
jgi:hypothetical protein